MQTYLKSTNALSNAEIADVYSLAEQHHVGLVLYSGTRSPSKGPAEWSASGSVFALRRFMKAAGLRTIPKPSYPEARWTDKNRWE